MTDIVEELAAALGADCVLTGDLALGYHPGESAVTPA
jgi:hypothetical protein